MRKSQVAEMRRKKEVISNEWKQEDDSQKGRKGGTLIGWNLACFSHDGKCYFDKWSEKKRKEEEELSSGDEEVLDGL